MRSVASLPWLFLIWIVDSFRFALVSNARVQGEGLVAAILPQSFAHSVTRGPSTPAAPECPPGALLPLFG